MYFFLKELDKYYETSESCLRKTQNLSISRDYTYIFGKCQTNRGIFQRIKTSLNSASRLPVDLISAAVALASQSSHADSSLARAAACCTGRSIQHTTAMPNASGCVGAMQKRHLIKQMNSRRRVSIIIAARVAIQMRSLRKRKRGQRRPQRMHLRMIEQL